MDHEMNTSDINQEDYPLQPKKKLEIQDPTSHILLTVTEIQDKFAELVSRVNIPELTLNKAAEIYMAIPGVNSKFATARSTASRLMNREDVSDRIKAYRRVFRTSKEHLLVEREILTEKIKNAWEDREMYEGPDADKSAGPVVRTHDVLSAYKDREMAHGIHAETVQKHIIVRVQSNNPQDLLKEAEDIIDAEVITAKGSVA